jgi:hypothetical protein
MTGTHVPPERSSAADEASLPEDLLAEQCARVQMLHALGVALWRSTS